MVLDPTCGEAVFLEAAGRELAALGCAKRALRNQLRGVDLHDGSIATSRRILGRQGFDGSFIADDFLSLSTPDKLDARLPYVDAVIGNPPFVRYQRHVGLERKRAQQAALQQGVRLSGLASSWAALLVHACGFLKADGRLAMVLPAELLSVGYAEPVRRWLKRRFKAVHLVMFERLQFDDVLEKVVLVLARGSGGCNAFSLVPVSDADDLPDIRMFGPMHLTVAPTDDGKWTDFLLPVEQRQLFDRVVSDHFVPFRDYGAPTLGTVTGRNDFFCLSEPTRQEVGIHPRHVVESCPPGTKHLKGLSFTRGNWEALRDAGERVWLLRPQHPALDLIREAGLRTYIEAGEAQGIHLGYKCRIRDPWYRAPAVDPPDLFFTYMSHRYPRVVANAARVTFVNSMHGVRLEPNAPRETKLALPLLMLNSLSMLGAEIYGRSYGGGVLKMEPSEAGCLPVPSADRLKTAWRTLRADKPKLDRKLRDGLWTSVVKRVDDAVLRRACGLTEEQTVQLAEAARTLRSQRLGHGAPSPE